MQYADQFIRLDVPAGFTVARQKRNMIWNLTRGKWLISMHVMSRELGSLLEHNIRTDSAPVPGYAKSEMRELRLGDSVAIYRESVKLVRAKLFSKNTQMMIPHPNFIVFLEFDHRSDFDVASDFIDFLNSIKVNVDALEFDTDDDEEDFSRYDETEGTLTGDLYDDTIVIFRVPEELELDDASREIGRYFLTREDLKIELAPLGYEPPDTFDEAREALRLGTAGDDCAEIRAGENSGVAFEVPKTEQEDGTYYEYSLVLEAGGEYFTIEISDRHPIALDEFNDFLASVAPSRRD